MATVTSARSIIMPAGTNEKQSCDGHEGLNARRPISGHSRPPSASNRISGTIKATPSYLDAVAADLVSDFDSDSDVSDVDDAALEAQLDAELLALRSMRDEDLHGGDGDGSDDDGQGGDSGSDDEEFQQLIQFKPRCTFKTSSSLQQLSTSMFASSNGDGAAAPASATATSSPAQPVPPVLPDIENDESLWSVPEFSVDGISVARPSTAAAAPASSRRPTSASASRSRPSTASRTSSQIDAASLNEEKTRAGSSSPVSPIPSSLTSASADTTDAFIQSLEGELTDIRSLLTHAPTASELQQQLLRQGVDIASWSRVRREELVREATEAAMQMEKEWRRRNETILKQAQARAATATTAQDGAQEAQESESVTSSSSPSPESTATAGTGSELSASRPQSPTDVTSTTLPPLLPTEPPILPSEVGSPSPSIMSSPSNSTSSSSFPLSTSTSSLPSISVSASISSLPHRLARDELLSSFVSEVVAPSIRRTNTSAAGDSQHDADNIDDAAARHRRQEDEMKKAALYRKVQAKNWAMKEAKRLEKIKAQRERNEAELRQREAQRIRTMQTIRERAAMREEDVRASTLHNQKRSAVDAAKRLQQLQRQLRESEAMKREDARDSLRHQRKMERLKAERAERERLEHIRMEQERHKAEEAARIAEEYARRKREAEAAKRAEEERQAKLKAQAEAEERARQEREEAERRKVEEEALRMKQELLRAKLEAEQMAKQKAAEEAARAAKQAVEEESRRQELIQRELARQAAEEEARRIQAEKEKREREEAEKARVEAEKAERARLEALRIAEERARAEAEYLDNLCEEKARLIQRVLRGYLVRSRNPARRELLGRLEELHRRRFRGAQLMQALWRGYRFRRRLHRVREAARRGLLDHDHPGADSEEDEYDYGGVDPSFYTIDDMPEFEMKLPPEAQMLLERSLKQSGADKLIARANNAPGGGEIPMDMDMLQQQSMHASRHTTQDHGGYSRSSATQPAASPRSDRVHSAGGGGIGAISSPSPADRGDVAPSHYSQRPASSSHTGVSTQSSYPPIQQSYGGAESMPALPQVSKYNNFFGAGPGPGAASGNIQPSQPSSPSPTESYTKLPRIGTPNSNSNRASHSSSSSDRDQMDSARSRRSTADVSSRPIGSSPTAATTSSPSPSVPGSRAAKLAELSAAWGISDPRTLEAMLRKKAKMKKMKDAKRIANMNAEERLNKFKHVAQVDTMQSREHSNQGGADVRRSVSGGGGGGGIKAKKKRKGGVPAAWLNGGAGVAAQGSTAEHDGGGSKMANTMPDRGGYEYDSPALSVHHRLRTPSTPPSAAASGAGHMPHPQSLPLHALANTNLNPPSAPYPGGYAGQVYNGMPVSPASSTSTASLSSRPVQAAHPGGFTYGAHSSTQANVEGRSGGGGGGRNAMHAAIAGAWMQGMQNRAPISAKKRG